MYYYNIKINSNDGEYCLNSFDKDIVQREMDIYFAVMFGASQEFIDKIKKPKIKTARGEQIDKETDADFVQTKEQSTLEGDFEQANTQSASQMKDENVKPEYNQTSDYKDDFTNLENPVLTVSSESVSALRTDSGEQVKFSNLSAVQESNQNETKNTSGLVFRPLAQEDLVFKNSENTREKEIIKAVDTYTLTDENLKEKTAPKAEKGELEVVSVKTSSLASDIENNGEIKSETPKHNTQVENQNSNSNSSDDFEIIGLDEDKKAEEQKLKEKKLNDINETIGMVQNAVNNIDISSDETFDVDIPDTYSMSRISENIELKEFDEDFDNDIDREFAKELDEEISGVNLPIYGQIPDNVRQIETEQQIQNEANNTDSGLVILDVNNDNVSPDSSEGENVKIDAQINSIFSSGSTFENPPESQNIIAAKDYPEDKQTLNLDFKTFLSNYESNGIIDEFLICAYYIKHIMGQSSFNMKYINSKMFQATGKIADLSIVDSLVNGDFIKVVEVEGTKKYTVTSMGEEYFMSHYQR